MANTRDYLKKKRSVITIPINDDFSLGRALVVLIARIEKDPKYRQIADSRRPVQLDRALDLHQAANVPFGRCGMDEVKLFQQYLINYQIIVVSEDRNIIYPPKPPGTDEKPSITLYYHNKHFDAITSLSGFLNRSHFCYRCHKSYDHTAGHVCSDMCRSCRAFGCVFEGDGIRCNEYRRMFKSQSCYDHHKEPINHGGRSVCDVIRKCKKCEREMDVRHLKKELCVRC